MGKKSKKEKIVVVAEQEMENTTSEAIVPEVKEKKSKKEKVVEITDEKAKKVEELSQEAATLAQESTFEYVKNRLLRTELHLHKIAVKLQKSVDRPERKTNKNKEQKDKQRKENLAKLLEEQEKE